MSDEQGTEVQLECLVVNEKKLVQLWYCQKRVLSGSYEGMWLRLECPLALVQSRGQGKVEMG